jgi:outer membrane protein OmpA-like peptidoglycan-associated protein
MKQIITIFTIVISLLPNVAFDQKTTNSWSIDACFGGTNPVKPYSLGYWSNTVSFFHSSAGARYMFNNKFGIKLDGGYDRVTNDIVGNNGNSLPFKSHYYRTSIQGVLDIGRVFTFENFSEKTSLLFHAGLGSSWLTSKVGAKRDRMVNFLFGFTPQYKINKRMAINVDATFIWHIYQQYTFDMYSAVTKRGFDGFIANATVGVNYYLGKHPEHHDWSFSPCYPDMRYLEDENNKLKVENEELAKKLGDDDNDGVINYLDEEDNTEIGALVDNKGRSLKNIDTDGDGINDFYDECPNEKGDQVNSGCPEKSTNNIANNQNNNSNNTANNNSNNTSTNPNNNTSNPNNNNANNTANNNSNNTSTNPNNNTSNPNNNNNANNTANNNSNNTSTNPNNNTSNPNNNNNANNTANNNSNNTTSNQNNNNANNTSNNNSNNTSTNPNNNASNQNNNNANNTSNNNSNNTTTNPNNNNANNTSNNNSNNTTTNPNNNNANNTSNNNSNNTSTNPNNNSSNQNNNNTNNTSNNNSNNTSTNPNNNASNQNNNNANNTSNNNSNNTTTNPNNNNANNTSNNNSNNTTTNPNNNNANNTSNNNSNNTTTNPNNNNANNTSNNNSNNTSTNPNNNASNQNNNNANNNSNNNSNNTSTNPNNNISNQNSSSNAQNNPEYNDYKNSTSGLTSVTDLHFAQWQSGFLPQEYAVISEIVTLLKSNSAKKIVIVGHADNGGEYSKKMEISKKRAEAVKNYLVAAGVSADKIETKYVGDLEPKYLNNTVTGKSLNRRAEIFIEK